LQSGNAEIYRGGLMHRESYQDYMARRMREDKIITPRPGTRPGLTSIERDLYQRIEELERWRMTFIVPFEQGEGPVEKIDSNLDQLEMEI